MAFLSSRPQGGSTNVPKHPVIQVIILVALLVLLVHGYPWWPPLP